ncbi:hypothetical protein ACFSWE_11280 [Leucobacter albus]|uniref:DUF1700 domain-containing protein n=1 Tax=Leucobacter albus TaxID=272210 RepID=A0ABW3TQ78_9MICO
MTTSQPTPHTAESLCASYLAQLDNAIAELPHGLAVELRAGVAEELAGLDLAAVQQRIAALGSPESVARAALDASLGAEFVPRPVSAPAPQVTIVAPQPLPLTETRGYAIAAALAIGGGGLVVPFAGWVVGCALVSTSKLWRTSEKLWAITFPFITVAIAWLVSLLGRVFAEAGSTPATLSLRYADPAPVDPTVNPLLPAFYDSAWSAVFLVAIVVAPLTGVWLLTRLRGRRSAADTRR